MDCLPKQSMEIELVSKMELNKKVIIKNFFGFYLKKLMQENESLNISYLNKLKEEYCQLNAE